jgi:hypothetical protein
MKTTAAVNATVFDLHTAERAIEAEDWISANLEDTSGFRDAFPDAIPLTRILKSGGEIIRYAIDPSASWHGETWIASVRVIFARPDGSSGSDLKDAPFMGSFTFAEDAMERAKSVQVTSVDQHGTVVIAAPNVADGIDTSH